MSSRRVLKAAEAIREVVAMAILVELKDPRIQNVTVTFVEVSPDLRQAKVHVSVMGDETQQRLSLLGLQNSAGYLQRKVGDRLDTRYTPRIAFVLDKGIKNAQAVARILNEVLPKPVSEEGEFDDEDLSDEDEGDDSRSTAGSEEPHASEETGGESAKPE
ncbi:MAG: 30S ribosome-binding factor RbfA [Planctomycetota bacterium]|jgi:ribosome-binding factor A|nr:30S ribosome-binding factor RbfA [Blastopirellula sp.]